MTTSVADNQVFTRLPAEIAAAIAAVGEEVFLPAGAVLHSNVGVPVGSVYFPHSGVISVCSNFATGAQVEVASIGREGAFGLFSLLGVPLHSMIAEVTIETRATTAPRADVRRLYGASAAFRSVVLDYLAQLFNDVVQSVGCYRFHTHDQWVARWLLTTADRTGTDTFAVTHDLIARRLGSQRHAVSRTLAILREANAIDYDRGRLSILNRVRLQSASCGCYSQVAPEVEHGT